MPVPGIAFPSSRIFGVTGVLGTSIVGHYQYCSSVKKKKKKKNQISLKSKLNKIRVNNVNVIMIF